jgi:hypothetical protein
MGHFPKCPPIEMRKPWSSSSQIFSTVPALPSVNTNGFANELCLNPFIRSQDGGYMSEKFRHLFDPSRETLFGERCLMLRDERAMAVKRR